jgi:hypothetical protein
VAIILDKLLLFNGAYGTGVTAGHKVVIVDMAVAGLVLNALSVALFLLLIYGLGKFQAPINPNVHPQKIE